MLSRSSTALRQGRVEKLRHHREQPAGACHQRSMGGGGEHGEPGARKARNIPDHPAAGQQDQIT